MWKLNEPIVLGKLVDGKMWSADKAKIDDVEARVKSAMVRLGSKAGTQNIDRILRLPGTTNLPNKKKLTTGRVACPARLIRFSDMTHPLDARRRSGAAGRVGPAPEVGKVSTRYRSPSG